MPQARLRCRADRLDRRRAEGARFQSGDAGYGGAAGGAHRVLPLSTPVPRCRTACTAIGWIYCCMQCRHYGPVLFGGTGRLGLVVLHCVGSYLLAIRFDRLPL